jgi:hypothetical protein
MAQSLDLANSRIPSHALPPSHAKKQKERNGLRKEAAAPGAREQPAD